MERSAAKVSSGFHIRFDNAYYSVPEKFLRQKVSVRATADKVWVAPMTGVPIFSFPRATCTGQRSTASSHLPEHYRDFADWNGHYFVRQAMTAGPNTAGVIQIVLLSRKPAVQTYRMYLGILNFTRKYSK